MTEAVEDAETFYESLDRLLSSSNSSTSASDTEENDVVLNPKTINFLPPSARSYDVWMSADSFLLPTSLQRRRHRLLLALGLEPEPRSRDDCHLTVSDSCYNCGDADRSVFINNNDDDGNNCSILSIRSVSHTVNIDRCCGNDDSIDDNINTYYGGGNNDGNCNGVEKVESVCMIKDLDNGKEFVVKNEGKLKEVGTGRHLTMEEFEMCVGHSPIVQELMRRQNVEDQLQRGKNMAENAECDGNGDEDGEGGLKLKKKKVSWLKSIKNVASSVTGYKERRSSDEKDTSSERGGRRSSSATDDSQDGSFNGPERVRVRQYGKSVKDLTAVYKSQEIQAHNGSIWTIKFSLDGRYLASAGEDCVIHVWQVVESERKGELLIDRPVDDGGLNLLLLTNGSPEPSLLSSSLENPLERRRRSGRASVSRKSVSLDHIVVPETVFGLSEKPFCSFQGHSDDVLDLSWSKSELLLSSSMDKTVRLWNLSSKTCLKIFSHGDYG